MKKLVFAIFCFLVFAVAPMMAQKEVAIISVIEYTEVLDGGNSKMFITMNGKTEEVALKGLFAIAGYINEKNLKGNDAAVSKKLSDLQKEGWEISNVAAIIRPTGTGSQPGALVTRYILMK